MRPKHIETPEAMWDLFEAYKRWCKENPRYSYSLSTKTGEATAIPLERPLTQVGFRTFAAEKGQTVNDYFCNKGDRYSEYATICSRIEEAIRMDQRARPLEDDTEAQGPRKANDIVAPAFSCAAGPSCRRDLHAHFTA